MPTAPKVYRPHRTKRRPDARPSAYARGYCDERWNRIRESFIREQFRIGNINCGECGKVLTGKLEVDHKAPHKGRDDPLYDAPSNLQVLHKACHSRKTVRENGGFGR